MFLLETDIGNYGTYRDLFLDMKHRGVEKVKFTCKYVLSVVCSGWLTFEEVTKLYEAEKGGYDL